jgi:hypothetical protein
VLVANVTTGQQVLIGRGLARELEWGSTYEYVGWRQFDSMTRRSAAWTLSYETAASCKDVRYIVPVENDWPRLATSEAPTERDHVASLLWSTYPMSM